MKFRTIDLRCLVCDLSIRFKVAVRNPDMLDLAVMEKRAWTDCPRCAEHLYVGKEYTAACDFRNPLDDSVIAAEIAAHYAALGYSLPTIQRVDSFRAAWAAWDARDASWIAACVPCASEIGDEKTLSVFRPILRAMQHGLWLYWYFDDLFLWMPQPRVQCDDRRRLHRADGAAFQLPSESLWFWHGVLVTQQIVEQPDTITAQQILDERNAEVRRVMVERLGVDRFLIGANAQPIDRDDAGRALYSIPLPDDEPMVAVKVTCPTTEQVYFLRVPPTVKRCDEAVAWTFGYERVADYAPQVET